MPDLDNYEIVDETQSSNWSKEQMLSHKQITMNQLARITKINSQEMCGGYWKQLPVRTGTGGIMMQQIYIEDRRKQSINATKVFYDLLLPEFNTKMKEGDKKIKKTLEDSRKKFVKEKRKDTEWIDYELKIYREILQHLIQLIADLGYFQEQEITA